MSDTKTKSIHIRLTPGQLARIDRARGVYSRAAYVLNAVLHYMDHVADLRPPTATGPILPRGGVTEEDIERLREAVGTQGPRSASPEELDRLARDPGINREMKGYGRDELP